MENSGSVFILSSRKLCRRSRYFYGNLSAVKRVCGYITSWGDSYSKKWPCRWYADDGMFSDGSAPRDWRGDIRYLLKAKVW